MDLDDGSGLGAPVRFETRRAEHMPTGESMLWSLEETAPANAMILEICRLTFVGRLMEEFQQIATMHLCCSNLLRLSLASAISQLAKELFKTEINSCAKLFPIAPERKSRNITSTCEDPAISVLMSFRVMPDTNIDTSVNESRRLHSVPTLGLTKVILEVSWGYATHDIFAWPMSVTETLESFI